MKREIERFIVGEAKKIVARQIQDIAKDPAGFFTPHYEKITVFAFSGKDGDWRVSKGSVSPSLSDRIIGICGVAGICEGWIAFKSEDGRSWVDCSSSIPAPVQQRIANAIHTR